MKRPLLILQLACGVCAAAAVLFALLCFVLPQGRTLLIVLCAVFFLLLSVNVHLLQRKKKASVANALDRAA